LQLQARVAALQADLEALRQLLLGTSAAADAARLAASEAASAADGMHHDLAKLLRRWRHALAEEEEEEEQGGRLGAASAAAAAAAPERCDLVGAAARGLCELDQVLAEAGQQLQVVAGAAEGAADALGRAAAAGAYGGRLSCCRCRPCSPALPCPLTSCSGLRACVLALPGARQRRGRAMAVRAL
jgi:hypothetical protein